MEEPIGLKVIPRLAKLKLGLTRELGDIDRLLRHLSVGLNLIRYDWSGSFTLPNSDIRWPTIHIIPLSEIKSGILLLHIAGILESV